MWRRKGWAAMDTLRERLEDLKELRDLVRSLGRGGGWGPLRRAPVQVRRASSMLPSGITDLVDGPLCLGGHMDQHLLLRWTIPKYGQSQQTNLDTFWPQHLDMRGRPGLLRTVLEAQETRGLTRSDDISRLLPSEVRHPTDAQGPSA